MGHETCVFPHALRAFEGFLSELWVSTFLDPCYLALLCKDRD